MTRLVRGRLILGALVILAILVAVFAAPVKLVGWVGHDLAGRAQSDVRKFLPAQEVAFLERPDARTTVHRAGRNDLRVVCGWLTTNQADLAPAAPRFFYVLYELRFAWISTEAVLVQSRPDELSPGWGETWCRSKPLEVSGL